ncbi:MAG: PqqD family protein [Novosphingobium sp.]
METAEKAWRPAASVIYSDLDDGAALLETTKNVYYSLAGTGYFLWGELLKGADFSALCSALADAFEVSPDVAEADVADWIGAMAGAGLIEERERA